MTNIEKEIFTNLFREVCEKCFSKPLEEPLKEPDAKHLSDEIQEKTGLMIGWKSIKNFSLYATHSELKKEENPSIATLDTLARYVLNAPVTDDLKRKATESHYAYWYDYKSRFATRQPRERKNVSGSWKKVLVATGGLLIAALTGIFIYSQLQSENKHHQFADDFSSVSMESLTSNGWIVKKPTNQYWRKRDERAGHLTLHTLRGDNWRSDDTSPGISDLLVRKIGNDCFSTEIHLTDFVPHQNWQQAGILLSEDSTFEGNVLRLSIAYNNFFGGFDKPSEIIVQVVASNAPAGLSKPEEIAHVVLFTGDVQKDSLIRSNLSKSALKIEKRSNHYRFLFTHGRMERFAFKEAVHRDIDIQPKYLGLFAMQGLSDSENPIPVHFDSFNLIDIDCDK